MVLRFNLNDSFQDDNDEFETFMETLVMGSLGASCMLVLIGVVASAHYFVWKFIPGDDVSEDSIAKIDAPLTSPSGNFDLILR